MRKVFSQLLAMSAMLSATGQYRDEKTGIKASSLINRANYNRNGTTRTGRNQRKRRKAIRQNPHLLRSKKYAKNRK